MIILSLIGRLQKLNVGFCIGMVGFLSSLPLLYQAGPSMLPLYYVYGYKVPVHILAPCLCIGVFWLYGSRRLASRVQGKDNLPEIIIFVIQKALLLMFNTSLLATKQLL